MTLKYFNVKNGLVTGNITLDATSSNVTANTFIGNISVTSSANLGNVGNITITGGSSGQVLSTNGSGSLSWVTPTSGNVSLQLPSVSVDSFVADGSNNSFTLTETPNNTDYVFVNVDGVFQFRDSFTLSGNVLTFGSIPETDSIIEISTMVPGAASGSSSVNVANVVGIGNIATINKDGNSSNVLYGNGVFASLPATGASYAWTIVSSNVSTAAFNGYFVDTSVGAKTITLPGSPSLGDSIKINDLAGTFGSNNLTVSRNGQPIEGVAADLTVDYNQATLEIVYSNSTYGWKVIGL